MGFIQNRIQAKREANVHRFLRSSGYVTLDALQEAIENGALLQRYDLDTTENRDRYNRVNPLVGMNVPAPVTNVPGYGAMGHNAVTQLDPADATSPNGAGLWEMVKQYIPLRDCFYHRDKEREVAKGLVDTYKELQRVYADREAITVDPTTNNVITQRNKLTIDEAGSLVQARRYKTTRSTLEHLLPQLGYVGSVEVEETVTAPAYGYGTAVNTVVSTTHSVPTGQDIRDSYAELTLNPKTWLQAMPEGTLAFIREGAFIGGAVGTAGLGAVALGIYGAAKAGQVVGGVAGSGISHVARNNNSLRSYIGNEDGLENFAQLTGKIGGLAAYSGTASVLAGGLAVGWVTGTLGASALSRYVGNRKRQNARESRRQLEEVLQTGGTDTALQSQVENYINSAERWEAASAGFDILSLVGLVAGAASGPINSTNIGDYIIPNALVGAIGGSDSGSDGSVADAVVNPNDSFVTGELIPSGDGASPIFDYIAALVPNTLCEGDSVDFSAVVSDNDDLQTVTAYLFDAGDYDAINTELNAVTSTVDVDMIEGLALQHDVVYEDSSLNPFDDFVLGDDVENVDGSFTPNDIGSYKVLMIANDAEQGHSFGWVDHTYEIGVCESDGTPVPSADGSDRSDSATAEDPSKMYGTHLEEGDFGRNYHDHGTFDCGEYKNGAPHESALDWTNKVIDFDLRNGDAHTAGINNIADDSHIFVELYKDGKLDHAEFVDIVEVGGKNTFDVSHINFNDYDGHQVWWATAEMEGDQLCVESLASISVGDYIVEAEDCGSCHSEPVCNDGGNDNGRSPVRAVPHDLNVDISKDNGILHQRVQSDGQGVGYATETWTKNGYGSYVVQYDGPGSTDTLLRSIADSTATRGSIEGHGLVTGLQDTGSFGMDAPHWARPIDNPDLGTTHQHSGSQQNTGSSWQSNPAHQSGQGHPSGNNGAGWNFGAPAHQSGSSSGVGATQGGWNVQGPAQQHSSVWTPTDSYIVFDSSDTWNWLLNGQQKTTEEIRIV
jgi:hypothetical protein